VSSAKPAVTEDELAALLQTQVTALNAEDLTAVFRMADSRLENRQAKRDILERVCSAYDLKHEVAAFQLLYAEEDFAVARFKQTIRRVAGPEFKDHEVLVLQAFRRREGKWMISVKANIERRDLDPAPPAAAPEKEGS
jgi:hypothetical protein